MKPPATIRVTAEHIAQGVPCESYNCPIALAICEQWQPGASQASVWADAIVSLPSGDSWTAKLPDAAFRWLTEFDEEVPVEPFEFELNWRRS